MSTMSNVEGAVALCVLPLQSSNPVPFTQWISDPHRYHWSDNTTVTLGFSEWQGREVSGNIHCSFLRSRAENLPLRTLQELMGKGVHHDSKFEGHLMGIHFSGSGRNLVSWFWRPETLMVCGVFYLLKRIVKGRYRVKSLSPMGLSLNPSPVVWFWALNFSKSSFSHL